MSFFLKKIFYMNICDRIDLRGWGGGVMNIPQDRRDAACNNDLISIYSIYTISLFFLFLINRPYNLDT